MRVIPQILIGLCLIVVSNEGCVNNNLKQDNSIVGSPEMSINDSVFFEFKKCSATSNFIEIIWEREHWATIDTGKEAPFIYTKREIISYSKDHKQIMQIIDSFPPIKRQSIDSVHNVLMIGDIFLFFKCNKDTLIRFILPPVSRETGDFAININGKYYKVNIRKLFKTLEILKTNR